MIRLILATLISGLVLGSFLRAAQAYSPELLPWAVGFVLACVAANLSGVIDQ